MSESFNLDREQNILHNVDALGKKWNIQNIRGSSMYLARPEPYREDYEIPKCMQGKWTKVELLREQIQFHVKRTWDHADGIQAKSAGKARAVKAKTNEESMADLDPAIAKELGDAIK